tara:strand:+ start:60 stop:212 length:153 start_codon:yes stop_codon:yes gene_type:complete
MSELKRGNTYDYDPTTKTFTQRRKTEGLTDRQKEIKLKQDKDPNHYDHYA